ncbi:MAG: serine--tRNA ligase, partial [Planctomycetota bacterium]
MIDIKQIRENPQRFAEASKAKKFDVDIDRLMKIDASLRTAKQALQEISTDKNRVGKSIPTLSADEKQAALAQLAELKQQEARYDQDVRELQPQFDSLMQQVAQPADDDVPLGEDDTENVEIRKEGQVRQFDFEPKDHLQLGLDLGIVDVERGVKLAGTRNYFLKGDGALLH